MQARKREQHKFELERMKSENSLWQKDEVYQMMLKCDEKEKNMELERLSFEREKRNL